MKNQRITFLSTTFAVLIVLATFGFVRINQMTNIEELKVMQSETKAILKDYEVRSGQEVIEDGSIVVDSGSTVNDKAGAPTITFSPYAGQIKKGSKVRVTATDSDKVTQVQYAWDYPSGTVMNRNFDSSHMVVETKCDIEVPSTTGIHVLRVNATDSKGNRTNNIFVPYYVVTTTPVTDKTLPETDMSKSSLYPHNNYTLYFTDQITIAGKDNESGIYAIGYAWDSQNNLKTFINPTDSKITIDVPQSKGSHTLYYTFWNSQRTDDHYMANAFYITYNVEDNIAPKLTKILNKDILEITVGQSLPSDAAIIAQLEYSDNVDAKSDITVQIDKSEINPNKAGKYENKLIITLIDKSGNKAKYNVDFNVKTKPYDVPVTEINESKVYNGQNQYITDFSLAAGTGAKTITYKQNGTAVTPKNAGSYDVYLTAKAGEVYSAIAETKIGVFTITKANPTISLTFDENVEGGVINYSPNKTAKLKASVLLGENPTLTYSSSNNNVATISSNGTITLKGKGQTTFTVKAAETANFKAATKTLKLTVNDNTKPVITLLGNNNIVLEVYTGTYVEAGATAIDDIDGDISSQIQITNNVNINQVGTYKVIYNVQDSAGNIADSVERTVTVRDTTKPTITDNPNNVYEMEVHGIKPSFTATATDNYDDHLTVSVSDNINVNKVGTYQVTFTCKDASNNTAQLVKEFIVKDSTKPVITIDSNNVYTMEVHGTIPTFNATATDNYDPSVNVVVTHDINKDVVGNYTITFTATDANGNVQTATKAFTVVDTTKPVITIDNNNVYSMEVHGTKPTFNATATDNYDSNVTVVVTDNINVDVVGTYTVTFTATDANGNVQTATKEFSVVDTTKPVISIDVNNVYEMEVHGTIPTFAATATDNYDATVNVVITHDINKDVTGTYTVTFTATDAHNNKQVETKSFEVKDTIKPEITLDVNNVYSMEVHGTKPTFNATATDNYDANVTVVVTDDIDVDVVGTYTVTFTATDAHNNTETVTKPFTVVDTTKPVITLNGDAEITLEAGRDSYTEQGATASDNYDTSVTVTTSGTVDTTVVGDYTISYNATDSNGNVADTVTRTIHVVDTTKPVITLNGDAVITLNVGEDLYTELGATAEDPYFGSIDSDDIVISGTVDTTVVGDYTISYNVVDAQNNAADTVTRTVKVVDVRKPVITVDDDNNVYSIEVHHEIPSFAATAIDNYDGTVNVVITNDINKDVVGTYTVTFTATDANGNAQVETREFTVVDTTKPVITVDDTNNVYEMEVFGEIPTFEAIATDNYDGNVTVVVTNNINKDVVGTYTVTFTAIDANNNTETATRSFEVKDTTKPVISLVGDAEITLEVLVDTYTEQGATATDNYDTTVTVTPSGTVDTTTVGTYTISYNATDSNGNVADTVTRTIYVVDTTKPVITLDTNNVYEMEVFGEIPTFAATATDTYDGTVNVEITNNINKDVVGTYTVTFKAKDANNNEEVVEKEFTVVDITKPVITLTGASEITLEAKVDTYTELGATATDNYDTTVEVTISGTVDTTTIGDYTISYNATDSNGNVADTVTRTIHVKDTTIPVISLVGDAEVIIEVNTIESYLDAGATATDNYDGDISSSIVKSGSVNVNEKGTYYINYNVKDSSNNAATQVTRTVKVVDTTEPLITPNVNNVYSMEVFGQIPELTATAYDLYDGNVAVSVDTSDINPNVVDTYIVVFTATDTTGNISTLEKEFTVVDTTKPEITLDTNNVYEMEVFGEIPTFNATATDNYDGAVDVTVTNNINKDVVGTYTVTFTATDANNNTEVVEKEFEVKDTTKPEITLDTNNVYEMEVFGEIPTFSATAEDNYDESVEVVITNNINKNVVGTYKVTFTSTDIHNNTEVVEKDFEVKDTTKPVITPDENNVYFMEVHGTKPEFNATALDNYDGTISVVITDDIDVDVVDTYTVTFTATDANGNVQVVEKDFEVKDTTKPEITLDVNNVYTMEVHGVIPSFAATAIDNYDASVTVVPTHNINKDVVGTYTVTFTATDANNNTEVVEKEFTVVDTTKPVITVDDVNNVYEMEVFGEIPTFEATATDNYDENVTVVVTNNINKDVVGTYIVTFTATDANNNTETATRSFEVKDTTKPVISLVGDAEITLEVLESTYTEQGATATDNYDENVIVTVSGSVNTNVVGDYTISYNATDSNGNAADTVTRTIHVVDTTKPVIALDNNNIYEMEVHGTKPEFNATALDSYDGNVNVVITDDINVDVVGTYTVTFTATDANNNSKVVEKSFEVKDTTKPVITVNTNNVYTMEVFGEIPSFAATATDNYDENVEVVITNNINKDVVGTYKVTFTATDAHNNTEVVEKEFTVVDTTKPVITLLGDAQVIIEVNTIESYLDAGATASDNYDGDISSSIVKSGSVDVHEIGTYYIKYNVTDANNNAATEVTRTVEVLDSTEPLITPNENNVYSMEVHTTIPSLTATAYDLYDGNVAVTVNTDDINVDVVGTYTVVFTATDTAGNVSTLEKEFEVKDTTKPVITVDDEHNTYEMEVFGEIPTFAATATDNYDATASVEVTHNIDKNVVGTYTVTFTSTDAHNNTEVVTRDFEVKDTTKPVITLTGASEIILEVKRDAYEELGATATDNYDGNITDNIVISGSVNTNVVGDYTISYNVTDVHNNVADTVTRTIHVVDTTKPVITLDENNVYTMEVHGDIPTFAATATDNYDENVTVVPTHNINKDVVGTYTVTFTATDANNNTQVETKEFTVVDSTKPVITLDENNVYSMEVHGTKPTFAATATDNYDENVTVVVTDNIDVDVVATYTVTFTATDANNNTQVVEKEFTVVDTTKPVIILTGASEITLEAKVDNYTELGATATDNYDTTVEVTISGTVNTNVVGNYTISYNATDAHGNIADTVTRTVHVVDTTKPVITLEGDAEMTLEALESTYTEPGATATDNYDGDITESIVISGSVNKDVVGDYTIRYNVTDANGNAADEVTRTIHVVDTTKPTIALDNNNVYSMEVFGQIPEFNATAIDSYDGLINVVVTNNINPTVVGTYKVTFTATDSHNNSKVVEKEFTVVDTTKPVITLNGDAEMTLEAKVNTYTEYGAVATDNYDGNITSRIVREGTVDTDVIGDYTITYNVTDTNGNAADQVTRTVHVKDSLAPTITVDDDNNNYDILVDGEIPEFKATASDIFDGTTTVTVDTSDIDVTTVGIYTIEFKSIDAHNNTATAYRNVNVIRRDLTAEDIILSVDNDTYDGTAKTVTAAVVDAKKDYAGTVTFEPQEVINAGDYTFTINVAQGTKYNAASFDKTLTINKANVDIKDISFGFTNNNVQYSTSGYEAILGSYDTNVLSATVKYYKGEEEVTEVKDIGTYKAVATFTLVDINNYDKILVNGVEGNILEDTITISEATIDTSGIVFENKTVDYTGSAVTMVATNIPEGVTVKYYVNGTEVENISVTEAGTYNVKVAIYSTDSNYNVDPTEKNAVLTINKIAYPTALIDAITFNKTFLYNGTAHTVTATNVPEDVTFTTDPASFIDAGDYNDVVVNFVTTNNNYNNPVSKTINVKVNPANPELVVTLSKTTLNVTDDSIQITATAQDFDTEEPITGLEYTYSVDSENGDEVSISDTGVITGNGHLGNVTIRVTTVATGNYAAASVTKNIEVVDTTAPVITLIGNTSVETPLGEAYQDAGVTVTDNFYTDVEPIVNIYKVEDQSAPVEAIDISREGMYIIKYDAVDGSGNHATQVTRIVYVKDKQAPVLTLVGDATETIQAKSVESYNDQGVTITDNYYTGEYLQQFVTRTYNPTTGVDVNTIGTYTITYGLADPSGNVAESVTRTINVVDTTKPVITLTGAADITLEAKADTYEELGATASDNYDGNLTEAIVITGEVNTNIVGDYQVKYNVEDSSHNAAVEVTRTVHVVDTTKPVITLVGNAEITLQVNVDTYEDQGATATDTYDGDITSRIVPTGIDDVDTTTVGTYTIYYNVTDTHNNAADTVTRTVKVVDTTKPVITVDDVNNVYEMEVHGDIPTFAATATDNYDGELTVPQPTHNIDKDVVGEYTIIFSVTDSNGNTQTATRSFTVKDSGKPTIDSITMPSQIEVHSEFTADDITVVASDNYDSASELTITKNISDLNVHSLGVYDIIITVKDKSGNTKEETRQIEVVDTTKPTAELIDGTLEDGVYHKTMEVLMDDATDADVIPVEIIVRDNYDADRVVTFPFGVARAKAAGYYTFTFTYKDSSENYGDPIQLGITVKKRDLDDSIKEHETVSVGYDGQDHKVVKNIPTGAGEATYRLVKHVGDTDVEVTEAIDVGSYTEYLAVATNGKYVGFDEIEIATIEITENALSDEDMIVTASSTEFNNTDLGNGTITTVINNVTTSYEITYVSDNQNVVTIDDTGAFTVVGKGTAHINVTFSSLNYASMTKTVTITVSDNSKPVISLEGETTQIIEIGNEYVEAGYSALDDSVNITSDVEVTWDTPYNKDVAGTYIVRYNVSDAAGNAADEVIRTITVEKTTVPTITYSGDLSVTLEAGDAYTELTQSDFTITDSYYTQDSDFTLSVEGTVDNRTVGDYEVTYKAIDRSNKESNTITRTVHVVDTTAPVLVTNPGTLQLSTTKGDGNPERVLSLSEIEATDNSSAALTLTKIDSTVQLNLAGTYTQTYKLADAAGNYITFNVSYRVYDRVSEVSYLENGQMILLQNGDTFTHNVKLYFDGTATLDGEAVSSGILVGEGEHTIIVTNDDGISLTINFTITIPRPEIIVKASPNGDPIELQPYNFYNEPIYLEFRNATKVIIVYYTTENVEQRVEITDPDLIAAGYVLTNANGTGNFTQYSINAIANDEENIIASIIVI